MAVHSSGTCDGPDRAEDYCDPTERAGPVAQFTFGDAGSIRRATPGTAFAALAGFGLAYLPEDSVMAHIAEGRLVRVLADWCPPYPGYHLYYPSRRQPTPAFALLVETLGYRN